MNGKFAAGFIVVTAVGAGAVMYWLQVYAFYREEGLAEAGPVTVVLQDGQVVEPQVTAFEAIDSDSSPIRFRSCFGADVTPATLTEAVPYDSPTPLTAPGWFDCFDARAIDEGIKAGTFRAFLSVRNVHPGVDRVVAFQTPMGSVASVAGYAWHQLNGELKE